MSNIRIPITPEGMKKLKDEIDELIKVERKKNIKDLQNARAQGDLSENAEYDAAKTKQGEINNKLKRLGQILSSANVIDTSRLIGTKKVSFGAFVTLENTVNNEVKTYQIVGEYEADINQNKLSITSPIVRAILTKSKGDECKVEISGRKTCYKIIDLEYKPSSDKKNDIK